MCFPGACAVCGREQFCGTSPSSLEDGGPGNSSLVSPLWEWQQKVQACLSCGWNTCCVIWEGWHIQVFQSQALHEPSPTPGCSVQR